MSRVEVRATIGTIATTNFVERLPYPKESGDVLPHIMLSGA
ncbi:hypothetical protein WN944_014109 [Citrus x changshan-huyou]|uniref:Uncharacterized protein n=1 Tax=Citrus x changshan-huyou TaxID=2935761 RepID=A0AAP0M554_9ROSI